ncbi:hypothetical protein BCV69DRAFT_138307 [Microstroma glucosiphilum]|uniref:Uncharacterized protein n=1 Tax=Pseudomicrostroma glucosiphilum TaxID=1684307 RepID=A0A316UAP2_9BASI|nr:hypothetical protein BCV69DRAFT_138307 [Pseudomicrostroma glucosiphilum]PWN22277.1 hypothetical protein BCV69DRAFT_138307 [Pseudomicrostroma glucosiphilum]
MSYADVQGDRPDVRRTHVTVVSLGLSAVTISMFILCSRTNLLLGARFPERAVVVHRGHVVPGATIRGRELKDACPLSAEGHRSEGTEDDSKLAHVRGYRYLYVSWPVSVRV